MLLYQNKFFSLNIMEVDIQNTYCVLFLLMRKYMVEKVNNEDIIMGKMTTFEDLEKENRQLKKRIEYLEKLLDKHHIVYHQIEKENHFINSEVITPRHAIIFYRLFKGRKDVYSQRHINKDGRVGYYPQCENFWKNEICLKKTNKKIKCKDCPNKKWKVLNQRVVMEHLKGNDINGNDVIGIYPMLEDETTNLLVFDFDNHEVGTDGENVDNSWKEEVNALREICQLHQIDILVERSRSGRGAHLWIFFDQPLPAITARRFGRALLNIGAQSINLKTFQTYDRMIPAQDHLADDGLGNLIALPLQGQALKKQNSAFVDENWNVYPHQWECLEKVKKLSLEFVEEKLELWKDKDIFSENYDYSISQPWIKENHFHKDDVNHHVDIKFANMVYIDTRSLKPRIQNQIRRLAAFRNKEFFKRRAMGLSVRGMNSWIECAIDIDYWICLPRGCLSVLRNELEKSQITYHIEDLRNSQKKIDVNFIGQLYDNQQKACETLLENDIGICHATTAFGKTVVGTNLIAQRKVNTLIIVHTNLIMNNWEDDLNRFLSVHEKLPTYTTPSGIKKTRKSIIGKLYSNHNSVTGIIDIAIVNSLITKGEIKDLVRNYGMIIVDECHHSASAMLYDVLTEVRAKYVYGFTATPKREDGLEQKTFMQLGPIRYQFTTKQRLQLQNVNHYIFPRFTRFIDLENTKISLNELYQKLIHDQERNQQILTDIKEALQNKRTPLIITKFKEHAQYLYEQLQGRSDHIFLLVGGKGHKTNRQIREKLKNINKQESVILVATAQYVGEGFNFPRLDTLFLTVPVSVESNIEQYSGRLHRDFEGKKDVIIYDYIDSHIKTLEKMYHKRMRTYKKMGYEICTTLHVREDEIQMIYDNSDYQKIFDKDIECANESIVISSPGLSQKSVNYYLRLFQSKLKENISITILTLDSKSYPKNMVEKTNILIQNLKENAIHVIVTSSLYEHYAIIDKEMIWYGNMNLLSNVKEQDYMMRISHQQLVYELLQETQKVMKEGKE